MKSKISLLFVFLALSYAATTPATPPTAEVIAPGLKHFVLLKGEAAAAASYRILIGVFDRQSEADQMLDRLHTNGFSAVADADGTDYRIVIPGFSLRAEAQDTRQRLIDQGFSLPLEIQKIERDLSHPEGPWTIHVLEADPKKIEVQVAHAYDAAIGLETTADLATRHGALAAINGGYFRMRGLLAGDNQGTLRIDGRLLSEPDRGRATVGFYEAEGTTRTVFGRLSFRGAVRFGDGAAETLDGINGPRGASEIILFTPEFHRTTLTSPGGAEVIVEDGRISEVRDGFGSSVIPASGAVLSIGGDRLEALRAQLKPGTLVSVETSVESLLPDPEREWDRAEDIIGAGPLLLWKGRRLEDHEKESISKVFFLARHPRTAVGARADGTLLFVTVDGRRPTASVGMSLPELTDLMLELGCVSAVNLDGGGSTTMVVGGQVVNQPSGGDARRNADGILLFPRAH